METPTAIKWRQRQYQNIIIIMRLFTALTVAACAFAMGACSEPAFNEAFDGGMTRGGNGEFIGFHKVVQTGENTTRPAIENEFTFDLYEVDKKGEVALIFAGLTTDTNGDVWFDDFTKFKGQGRTYFFKEVFANEEEAAKWEPLPELHFEMESNFGTHWNDERGSWEFNQGPVIVNIPVPEEIEEPVLGPLEESVTLSTGAYGAATVWPNTNHFCYAKLTRAQLEAGITLEAVEGNPCNDKGDAYAKLVDGKIVITINAKGEVCAFAQTEEPAPVQGNPHSGQEREHVEFDEEFAVDCPEGDVIYLYAHMNIQFYL